MTKAASTAPATPGTGLDLAAQEISSKVHLLGIQADADGHMAHTSAVFYAATGNTAHVAASRTTLFDLFNADATLKVDILGVYIIPALAAVTGVGQTYEIIRTSAVGTGGTSITPGKIDSAQAALDSDITCRTKPSGGATTDATNPLTIFCNGSSEETIPYASQASRLNHVASLTENILGKPIRLNQNEGIKVDQTTNSSVGNVCIAVVFRVV
jgi:hypothetical protein